CMMSLHISHPPNSSILVWLDGKPATLPWIAESESLFGRKPMDTSPFNTGIEGMLAMEGPLVDGDHQLVVKATALGEDLVVFDRVELRYAQNTSVAENYSTMAHSVPPAALVEDTFDLLQYSDSGWQRHRDPFFWSNTSSVSNTPGSSVQISFVGTGIWLFGSIPVEGVAFHVETIKKYGQETTRNVTTYNITRPGLDIPLYQAALFAMPSLPYTNMYTFNVTLISGTLQIDFFRIVGKAVPLDFAEVVPSDPITPPTTTPPSNQRIIIPVVCVAVFALVVGAGVLLRRKYFSKRIWSFGASQTTLIQSSQEKAVDPFPHSKSTDQSLRSTERRPAKGFFMRTYPDSTHPSTHSTLSALTSGIENSSFVVSSAIPTTGVAASSSSMEPFRLQGEDGGLRWEDGEEESEPLSLSHSDLARVFRRAEQLRRNATENENAESDGSPELEPALESLAAQLASRELLTG
ncbi:hypothetical protein FRC17_003962, partial [Serendipita sp. 399]